MGDDRKLHVSPFSTKRSGNLEPETTSLQYTGYDGYAELRANLLKCSLAHVVDPHVGYEARRKVEIGLAFPAEEALIRVLEVGTALVACADEADKALLLGFLKGPLTCWAYQIGAESKRLFIVDSSAREMLNHAVD